MKDVLKSGLKNSEKEDESPKEESGESAIVELVERVFTTRNLVHFAHWNTQSYASHMALGDLYDSIVEATDDIVENYQGEFGLLTGLETECAKLDKDIIEYILEDAQWVRSNQDRIARGSKAVSSLVDILVAAYNKTLYKLKNLK
jgi:hypothetical protein